MSEESMQPGISEENLSESNKKSSSRALGVIIAVVVIAVGAFAFARMRGTEPAEPQAESQGQEASMMEEESGEAMGEGAEGESMEEEGAMMEEESPAPGESMMEEDAAARAKEFNITGQNFAFSQDTITVKKGDTVRINFTSAGGFHDWTLDGFNARTEQVNEGQSSSVIFVADRAGSFEYYCGVGSHRALGMKGTLLVEE